ncbi:eIF4G [Aphelenchoides avenae]|nr:eIF4G [Aphelenchus avenae]
MASTLSLDDIGARKLAITAERQDLRDQISALDKQIALLEESRLALVKNEDALCTELNELNEAQVSLLQQQLNAVVQAGRPEHTATDDEKVQVQRHISKHEAAKAYDRDFLYELRETIDQHALPAPEVRQALEEHGVARQQETTESTRKPLPYTQQHAAQSIPDATQLSAHTMRLPTGTLINQERNPAYHTLVSVITPNVGGTGAYGMPAMSMSGMMPQQQGYMQLPQYGWNGGQYVTPTVQYVQGQQYMGPQGYVPVQAPHQPFPQMHQMPPPMSQPQYIQQAPPQHKKKVLAIFDSESKQEINELEVALTPNKSEKPSSTSPNPVGTIETEGHGLTKEESCEESVQESSEELVHKMEDHLARFHDNPEVQAEFDANVYSRDFLYVLRNVVRELQLEKPAMPHSLEEVGLDRRGMPDPQMMCAYVRRKKGPVGRPSMDRPQRQAYLLNRSENAWNPPRKVRKRDPTEWRAEPEESRREISLPATEQEVAEVPPLSQVLQMISKSVENVTLKRSENAWRPRRLWCDADGVNPEELGLQERVNEIRALLNKITPSTFTDLWTELKTLKIHEDEQFLSNVVEMIFERAVNEPMYASLYSDLCKNEVDHEAHLQVATKPFRRDLIKKAQATFEGAIVVQESIKEMEEELEAGNDEEKKQEKAAHLEALRTKEKHRLKGTIRFIGELYRHFLITDTVIQWCCVHLIKNYEETRDEVYVECIVHMIERVGSVFEARNAQRKQAEHTWSVNLIEQVMTCFLMRVEEALSNRMRFMILNLDELRQAGCKSPRFVREQVPKTIQEVHQEAMEEKIKNRVEHESSNY